MKFTATHVSGAKIEIIAVNRPQAERKLSEALRFGHLMGGVTVTPPSLDMMDTAPNAWTQLAYEPEGESCT